MARHLAISLNKLPWCCKTTCEQRRGAPASLPWNVRCNALSRTYKAPRPCQQPLRAAVSFNSEVQEAALVHDIVVDGYHIPPRFLDRLAVHITKNVMDLPGVQVPLILGLSGSKGQGKTFMCDMCCKLLHIKPFALGAEQLYEGAQGEPSPVIRAAYAAASAAIQRGEMAALFIHDLDAADKIQDSAVFAQQKVIATTLIDLADTPESVHLPGRGQRVAMHRVPIVCTGSNFRLLYAPLITDGRMEKFFWEPEHEDRVQMCSGIFRQDDISKADIELLVSSFPDQPIIFFEALRTKYHDDNLREYFFGADARDVSEGAQHTGGASAVPPVVPTLERLFQLSKVLLEQQAALNWALEEDSYRRMGKKPFSVFTSTNTAEDEEPVPGGN